MFPIEFYSDASTGEKILKLINEKLSVIFFDF